MQESCTQGWLQESVCVCTSLPAHLCVHIQNTHAHTQYLVRNPTLPDKKT